MIDEIIMLFYKVAEQHKLINSFKYDTLGRGQGVGNEFYPQLFLEESIFINNTNFQDNNNIITLSFDVLLLPQSLQNITEKELTTEEIQTVAYKIAENIIVKINAELKKLSQYNDPTAHFRMVREEIKNLS